MSTPIHRSGASSENYRQEDRERANPLLQESKTGKKAYEKLSEQRQTAAAYYLDAKRNRALLEKEIKELKKLEIKLNKLPANATKEKIDNLKIQIATKKYDINYRMERAQGFLKKELLSLEKTKQDKILFRAGVKEAAQTGKKPFQTIQKNISKLKSFFSFITGKSFTKKDIPKLEKLAVELEQLHNDYKKTHNPTEYHKTSLALGKALWEACGARKELPERMNSYTGQLELSLLNQIPLSKEAAICMLRYLVHEHPVKFADSVRQQQLHQLDQFLVKNQIITEGFIEKPQPREPLPQLPVIIEDEFVLEEITLPQTEILFDVDELGGALDLYRSSPTKENLINLLYYMESIFDLQLPLDKVITNAFKTMLSEALNYDPQIFKNVVLEKELVGVDQFLVKHSLISKSYF